METSWPNGHSCGWRGKAEYRNHQIVLDKDTEIPECILEIKKDKNKINFVSKTKDCSDYCGARGHMDIEFIKTNSESK